MIPAAFGPIAAEYKITKQKASYLTTTYTLLGGLTPLLLTPYVNMYGRRPAYLVCYFPIEDTDLDAEG
jgi:predicted MFS family arabinose efflux permease